MTQFQGTQISPETIRAAVDGDAAAHEFIYRHCSRPVYSLIRRLIPNAATADDIFQDVFVEVLRSIGSYTGEGAFAGWVRTIAVNKCLMHLRSPWHRSLFWIDADASEDDANSFVPIDPAPRPDAQAAAADLERALATLPALSRTVVLLHDVEGYKHHEIARMLGRSTGFSKSQLARAHMRLRGLLDPGLPKSQDGSLQCTPLSTSC
ncbi:MAG TPA: RNA polymerase sigma factor [Povalibacter sp.]|uniref:RNA polymerase sigma factor n=1 Tax=Povalibacter sp. TaxID=1962978 RepID=UPI002BED645A|nr:RNA polymerase sigma factor [Povalibacter sp.]HMN43219.1 RNA polymerase sigma factor [Povalibacter sp.]